MDLRQLECFVAVCQEMHFSKAAEKLHLSQPSLSQHIKNLEAYVGTPLFDRIGRRIALTEAGSILLAHTRRVFHEIEQAQAAIRDLHGLQRGKLAIGSLVTCASYLLPPVMLRFKEMYPNIELSVMALQANEIREQLLSNELDLGITSMPAGDDELQAIPLFAEELALTLPINHPMASSDQVPLQALADLTMVLLPKAFHVRTILDNYCTDMGMSLEPALEISPLDALVRLVADGVGATVLPAPYVDHLSNPKIMHVRLVDPTPQRVVGIVYRKGKFMCAATRAFIDQVTGPGATAAQPGDIEQGVL